jgi:hypothetical protein
MNQSKSMSVLETLAAGSLLASKYLLATGSIYGWIVAATGYFLTMIYNIKKDIKILAIVVVGLLFLCLYGWYKWSVGLKGLQVFDYTVIVLTIIFGLCFAYAEWKSKKPLWLQQIIITFLCMIAYIMLGLSLNGGWYCLATAHSILIYVYLRKGGYVYTVLQVASVYIALTKVTSLPLPF